MTAADPITPPALAEPKISGFYDAVLGRADMVAAARVEGIDEELAILRARLRATWAAHPDNADIVLKGIEVLVRVLSARHRISKKRLDDFIEAAVTVVTSLGEQFGLPPEDQV